MDANDHFDFAAGVLSTDSRPSTSYKVGSTVTINTLQVLPACSLRVTGKILTTNLTVQNDHDRQR